ncbi:hypothetical protein HDV01_002495 [Terramyces sp. JEL0728]|nr:hypothetical protein HDV01_002495 [Terramyces sp. JEL0728]
MPNWNLDISSIDKSAKCKTNPPAFSLKHKSESKEHKEVEQVDIDYLKIKKAWEMAISPSKTIPMNAFMLYMSGNAIQIFSIMVTVMLLWNSFNAIISCIVQFEQFQKVPVLGIDVFDAGGSTFETIRRLKESKITLPIIVFAILNLANFGLGVWKCGSMGLLPTTSSDWLAFLPAKTVLEHVVG